MMQALNLLVVAHAQRSGRCGWSGRTARAGAWGSLDSLRSWNQGVLEPASPPPTPWPCCIALAIAVDACCAGPRSAFLQRARQGGRAASRHVGLGGSRPCSRHCSWPVAAAFPHGPVHCCGRDHEALGAARKETVGLLGLLDRVLGGGAGRGRRSSTASSTASSARACSTDAAAAWQATQGARAGAASPTSAAAGPTAHQLALLPIHLMLG